MGKGQVYEYEEQSGNSYECPFCNDKGYTKGKIKVCPQCEGDGKLYAFKKKKWELLLFVNNVMVMDSFLLIKLIFMLKIKEI